MIDAKDLRIGNFVSFSPSGKAKQVRDRSVVVLRLLEKSCIVNDKGLELELFYESASLLPIPLTPEILGKCSWFKKLNQDEFVFARYSIREDESFDEPCFGFYILGNDKNFHWIRNIFYLHQLQNLFYSLTGSELEINFPGRTK